MTKQQEIEILDKAIKALGADSYLGPWLAQVRGEVERNIRSDYFPQITLSDSAKIVGAIVNQAHTQAKEIVSKAEAQAKQIRAESRNHQNNIASAIYQALREINKW